MSTLALPSRDPWYRSIHRNQWKTLFAAQAGWMLDGMDVMLYAFALTAIQQEFALSSAVAGSLASLTLVASAVGGSFAGILTGMTSRCSNRASWHCLLLCLLASFAARSAREIGRAHV